MRRSDGSVILAPCPFDDAPSRAQAALAPTWRALHPGEDPRAEALLFARLRDASAVEKFAAMRRLTVAARSIALAGLRRRYLGASEAELTRRLADLVLGGRACRTSLRPVLERARMSDDAELDPLRVAFLVTHTFEALGVRYFIGGSLASIFHGLIRTTNDADLVAELAPSHVTALVAALEGAFYIDAESIREAIRPQGEF
jgi:hypothetical protein